MISPALNYSETIEQANENLRLVLPMLAKFKLPPNPINYTLCYEYIAGANRELHNILDKVLKEEKGLSREAAIELYRRYIWDVERRTVEEQSKHLYVAMTDTISEIEHTTNETDKSRQMLGQYSEQLSESSNLLEMRDIISEVVLETRSIARSSNDLHQMLSETKQEVATLREELERSRQQATTDPLTGLLNRRAFDQELMQAASDVNESRENLSLLMIDIDNFKAVNDNHGHLIGDKVIRFVATQIRKNVKGRDIVARVGGEEYAVLLPKTQLDNARILAESIRGSIERSRLKRIDNSQPLGGITISIGVTSYKHGEVTEDFLQRADGALYKSKNGGKNRVSIAY
jgi:diguanylate cyclase